LGLECVPVRSVCAGRGLARDSAREFRVDATLVTLAIAALWPLVQLALGTTMSRGVTGRRR